MKVERVKMETDITGRVPWARGAHERTKAPWGGAVLSVSRLQEECDRIDASRVLLQVTGPKVEIRVDGEISLRSVLDPPVVVQIETRERVLVFRSDRYDTWYGNVHAVALTLERLRAVDRYGCAASGEQYHGWAQLPPARPTYQGKEIDWDVVGALNFLAKVAEVPVPAVPRSIEVARRVHTDLYRAAAKKAHPDTGGSDQLFVRVQAAGRVLGVVS